MWNLTASSALFVEARPAKSKLGRSHDWFLALSDIIVYCTKLSGREQEGKRERGREEERERPLRLTP